MATVEVNRAYEPPASELELQMKYGSPSKCIALSHSAPSVQMYYALRVRLETSSEAWLQEYMDLDGLDSLLDSLSNMTGKSFTSFSDAILRLDCISCIRAILNTSVGLDYMVQNESYVAKLALAKLRTKLHLFLAMDVGNTLPKKLVFEMLSAICAYNSLGYHSVLSALNHVKKMQQSVSIHQIIINELKTAETAANKTAILTLINCIVNCTSNVVERNRIRTEFAVSFGQLFKLVGYLIFHERKHEDDEVLSQEMGTTDFNSPEELIDIIQSKIFGSGKMASFVNILQDLLSIEMMYNKNSTKLWKVVEDLVHETIHANNSIEVSTEMSALELRMLPDHINIGLECIKQYQAESKFPHYQLIKKQNILWQEKSNFTSSDRTKYDNDTGVELTHNQIRYDTCDNVTDVMDYIDQSHCESTFLKVNESIYDNHTPTNKSALQKRYKIRRFPVPPPSKKLKSFQWVKLSEDTIDKHSNCIWQSTSPCSRFKPDYEQLEKMFYLDDSGFEDADEPFYIIREQVVILNNETRKNMNLFLSRVDIGAEDILQGIENENLEIITLPTLKYLQKVLPEKEELMLMSIDRK
ncbi:hypothetical protein KUTeg_004717 [Tegillarca granosa]|uniref:GBD/FH3 domain-containing protein n=1 Tax=Tegillarca granosa TaxID=220873 RepID=A0ABQ9FM75_TEGGR|nr:hypothetical protein KUTeg_004717 [Tegillarca granosa]